MAVNKSRNHIVESGTGSGAISYTTASAYGQAGLLLENFKVHLNAVGASGNLTVTLNSFLGATYDVVLDTQDMTSVADYTYTPSDANGLRLYPGDAITVAWANAGGKTYGYTASYVIAD